jgi:oligopeptide transport system substrate-binding protein
MQLGLGIRAITLATAGVFVFACGPGTTGGGGATPASADKQILRVNIDTEPSTLDPTQQQWVYESAVGRTTFEALVRPKSDLSDIEPAAASSWKISPDGLTWTFTLRPDGKYSDGSIVKAADFVYSYKRILDPTIAAPYADPFFDGIIKGAENYGNVDAKDPKAVKAFLDGIQVSAPDDKTFVVKLQNPAPWFKWIVSLWLAAPVKQSNVEAVGSANFGAVTDKAPTQVIGNGPFKISEVQAKDHITLVPNPNYRVKPILQKVVLLEISDANKEFAAFQNGELDITRGVPPANVATVLGDPKLSKAVLRGPTLLVWWIWINAKKKPFDNPDLRLAFAKSIDRDSYVKNVLKGIGTATTSFIAKGELGYEPTDDQKFDCTAAKASLAKAKAAGVTDAQLSGIHYQYRNSATRKTSAEFFQSQWQQCLGINVILDAKESKAASKDLHSGNYMMSGVSGWQADYPDQQDWFDTMTTGAGNNFSGWSNKDFDSLIQKGDTAAAQADRNTAYSAANKIMLKEAPFILLYQDEKFLLINPKLKGYTRTPLDDDWIGDVSSAATMFISA